MKIYKIKTNYNTIINYNYLIKNYFYTIIILLIKNKNENLKYKKYNYSILYFSKFIVKKSTTESRGAFTLKRNRSILFLGASKYFISYLF